MPPTAPRCPCSLLFPGKISSRCQFQQRPGRRVPETSQGSRLLVSVLFSLKKELTPITAEVDQASQSGDVDEKGGPSSTTCCPSGSGRDFLRSGSNGHLVDQAVHTLVENGLFKEKGH